MQNNIKPEDCIFFNLSNTARHATRYWKQAVSELGITGSQALLINLMAYEGEAILSSHLAELAKLDAATLTGLADRLEKQHLIQRTLSDTDRRVVYLSLTDKGKTISQSVQEILQASNEAYLSSMTDSQIRQFKNLLKKLGD